MSWFKAVSYSGDDVFDETGDDLDLQSKEWTSNMKKRVRDGFVDGADAAEDAFLQVGFNEGFREGAAQTVAVGRLKGIVSAVWCWCQIEHPETPVPASVTELLQQVTRHEDKITEGIKMTLENPPPSVSSVSESMEDLDVKQADQGCGGGGCDGGGCGGGGCGGEGCDGGGCEEKGCCRKGEKMDLDVSHMPQKPRSVSTDCSSSSDEGLELLLQRCMALVLELGLPQELINHIQELKNV